MPWRRFAFSKHSLVKACGRVADTLVERDLKHCGHSTTCPSWNNCMCRFMLRTLAYVLLQPDSVHWYTSTALSAGWARVMWLRSKHGLRKIFWQKSHCRTTQYIALYRYHIIKHWHIFITKWSSQQIIIIIWQLTSQNMARVKIEITRTVLEIPR